MNGPAVLPYRLRSRIRVDHHTGCWEWTGAHLTSGYGSVRWGNRSTVVHRVTYTLLVDVIPDTLQIDHLCRNRSCCNPEHLEPVTQQENLRRGQGFSGVNAQKAACPAGHDYTSENTYTRPSAPATRECRTCRDARNAAKRVTA